MARSSSSFKPTHGMSKTRLYREWAGIIYRCTNPKCSSWDRYGAKGVAVCKEWQTFENFKKWALKTGYKDYLTIDRIDSNGDYEPGNCRWATVREQANNKRKTIWIEYDGKRMPLSYWAESIGINYHTLYDRLYKFNWSVEKAFTAPVRRIMV